MKTSELTGAALDWAVAKTIGCELTTWNAHFRRIAKGAWSEEKINALLAERVDEPVVIDAHGNMTPVPAYSTDWRQGGPVIEREGISLLEAGGGWGARSKQDGLTIIRDRFGPTPLIAAMRCYVASKLGDEVDIPEELL